MNIVTVAGIGVMGVLIFMAVGGAAGIGAFVDMPSVQIVILGTAAGMFASYPLDKTLKLPSLLVKLFFGGSPGDPVETIKTLVEFAEKARKEGILALESSAGKIQDEFLKRGLNLAVDGTEAGLIKDIMKTDVSGTQARHEENVMIFEYVSGLAPAMGMVGTFIGLVLMLGNLDDISTLGPNMAIAVLTSLYGAIIANCIMNPLANVLKEKSKKEILLKTIMIEGIMSIVAGDNPRIVEQKLAACLDPISRTKVIKQR